MRVKPRTYMIFSALVAGGLMLVLATGCSTALKSGTKESDIYVKGVKGASLLSKNYSKRPCPKPSQLAGLERSSWRELVFRANGCVEERNWKMLKNVSDMLGQREFHSPWGAYYESLLAEKDGKLERSLWMINLALRKSGQVGVFRYQKGRVLWKLKQHTEAMNELKAAVSEDQALVGAHRMLGQIYMRDLQHKKAVDHLSVAVKSESVNLSTLNLLAMAQEHIGDYNDLLSTLDKAIQLAPNSLDLRLRKASLLETHLENVLGALSVYENIREGLRQRQFEGKLGFDLESKIKNLKSQVEGKKTARLADGTSVISKEEGVKP